jgi:hypothetical protein
MEPFIAVQDLRGNAQLLEVVENIRFNSLQPGLCHSQVVGLNAESQIFHLDQPVVSLGLLILEHFGVFAPDIIKIVAFTGNNDVLGKALFGSRGVEAGDLAADGRSK